MRIPFSLASFQITVIIRLKWYLCNARVFCFSILHISSGVYLIAKSFVFKVLARYENESVKQPLLDLESNNFLTRFLFFEWIPVNYTLKNIEFSEERNLMEVSDRLIQKLADFFNVYTTTSKWHSQGEYLLLLVAFT